jgi:hypothetical protein
MGLETPLPPRLRDMGIDHRRADVAMPQQFLNRPNIVPIF